YNTTRTSISRNPKNKTNLPANLPYKANRPTKSEPSTKNKPACKLTLQNQPSYKKQTVYKKQTYPPTYLTKLTLQSQPTKANNLQKANLPANLPYKKPAAQAVYKKKTYLTRPTKSKNN